MAGAPSVTAMASCASPPTTLFPDVTDHTISRFWVYFTLSTKSTGEKNLEGKKRRRMILPTLKGLYTPMSLGESGIFSEVIFPLLFLHPCTDNGIGQHGLCFLGARPSSKHLHGIIAIM